MNELNKRLAQFAQQETAVTIRYYGGSQPGTTRRVRPLLVADAYLKALDIFKNEVDALTDLGWRVVLTNDFIKLYANPSKEAIVGVKLNYDVMSLDESAVEQRVSSDRPWYVFDPDYMQCLVEPECPEDGLSYKHLNHAKKIFLEQARRHAPDRRQK